MKAEENNNNDESEKMRAEAISSQTAESSASPVFGSAGPEIMEGPRPCGRDYIIFGLVLALALIIRIVYVLQMRSSPLFGNPILDSELHDTWARTILDGRTLFEGAYFKAPLYPWVLSAIYAVSDGSYLAPRIVQAVLGSVSCGLLYLIGREVFGRVTGAIAGFAAATYWVMIYFDAELLLEPLSIFWSLLGLWLVCLAARRRGWGLWLLSGAVLGLSAITRPNVLVYMPLVALWLVLVNRRHLRYAFSRAAVFTIGCLLPILPITARNYMVGDDLVLIAAQAGPNFYIGNNEEADGCSAVMPGSRASLTGGYFDWQAIANTESGRHLKPSEVSRFFFTKSWDFMRTNPGSALKLMFKKLRLFFYEFDIVNNKDLYFYTERYAPFVRSLPVTSGLVLSLGVVGLLFSLGRSRHTFPLWSFAVVYSATVIAFFVCSRFRVPVMPVFILFASYVPVRLRSLVRERHWGVVVGCLAMTTLIWRFVHPGIPENVVRKGTARAHTQIAHALAKVGRMDESRREFEMAQALSPRMAEVDFAIGMSLLREGKVEEAISRLQKALSRRDSAEVYEHVARVLGRLGRWDEACGTLREGVSAFPAYLGLKQSLAFLLATCPVELHRDGQEAVRLAEEVRQTMTPVELRRPGVFDTLAVAYAEAGDFAKAIEATRYGLELAKQQQDSDAIQRFRSRRELFESGRPFRQPPSRRIQD